MTPGERAAIRRDLISLAWPAVLAMLVHNLYRLNDQFFVQDLGVEAQAAVAVGSMCGIFLIAFGEMVGIGTLAVAARRFGEGDHAAAFATIRRGLRLGMAIGLGLAAVVLLALPWLATRMIPGAEHVVERGLCIDYLTWIVSGQVVMIACQVNDQAFLAMRNTRTSLALQVIAVATNATLNWSLVPHYGIHGVGFATVASRFLAFAVGIVLLRSRGAGSPFAGMRSDAGIGASVGRILRIGFPACIAIAIYSLVYQVILAVTIKEFGPAARSALGIGFGVETIFYCLYWGVGSAVASLVGRYLGEGDTAKVLTVTRIAIVMNLAIGVGVSVIFLTAGPFLIGIFSDDPDVLATNRQYLNYMAIAQPFQALQVAFDNAVIGAGYTFPSMLGNVCMNCIRIPLAHLFAISWGFGLPGVWWAINISSVGKSIWAGLLYTARRWLHTRV